MSPQDAVKKLKKGTLVSCYGVEATVTRSYNSGFPKRVSVQLLQGAQRTSWLIEEVELVTK